MSRIVASAHKFSVLAPKYADLLTGHRIPIRDHDNRSLTTSPNPSRAPVSSPTASPIAPSAYIDQIRLPNLIAAGRFSDAVPVMPVLPDSFNHALAQSSSPVPASPTLLVIAAARPETVAPGGLGAVQSLGTEDLLEPAELGFATTTSTTIATTTNTASSAAVGRMSDFLGPTSGFWEAVLEDVLGPDYNKKTA